MEFAYFATTSGEEWRGWASRNAAVSGETIGVATEPSITSTNLGVAASDISIDQDEHVITLREGTVYQYDRANDRTDVVWSNADTGGVDDPRAVCVVGDRVYLADAASGDIVVVSRRTGAIVGRFDAGLIEPVDLVSTTHRLFVLDAGDAAASGRVLTLRRSGFVEPVVHGLVDPTDVAASASHLYIIEHPDGTPVIRVHDVGHLESPSIVPTSRTIEELTVAGTDHRVVPVRVGVLGDQELVLIGEESPSDERYLYHYTFDGAAWTLSRRDAFGFACTELLAGPRLEHRRYPKYYAIAGDDDEVYVIDERQAHTRNPADGRYTAQAFRRFDAGTIDTAWHRITLGFDALPANTRVVVSYTASNDPAFGSLEDAFEELSDDAIEALREAGIEGPWDFLEHDRAAIRALLDVDADQLDALTDAALEFLDGAAWTTAAGATEGDVLLEGVTGRYLCVRLELVGTVDASPQLASFRAYCPKLTYVRYLPELFQQGRTKSGFLAQYLSVFESEFVDIEAEIDRIGRFFDPEAVPTEYLSWLAEWLAVDHDGDWPESAKRAFLIEAPELFKARGTHEGMDRTIRVYLDRIEAPDTGWMSRWQKRRIEARRAEGWLDDDAAAAAFEEIDATTAGYGEGHHLYFLEHHHLDGLDAAARQPYTMHMRGSRSFVVFAGPFVSDAHRGEIADLVAADQPAHTHGRVVELKQECKLEGASFLGINTTLTTREFVLGVATLGGDAVLRERASPLSDV